MIMEALLLLRTNLLFALKRKGQYARLQILGNLHQMETWKKGYYRDRCIYLPIFSRFTAPQIRGGCIAGII